MATFKFGRTIDLHWNGYDIQGPAETVFSIPDQLYEEFDADIAPVEPTLVWIDTNEFLTLSNSVSVSQLNGTFPISVTTTTSGKNVAISSSTNPAGYTMVADGTGGVIFQAGSTGALTSVVGISPISSIVSGNTVSVILNANYQTAGTYVTGVSGTAPITASGTTAITVGIDQTALSVADASTATTLRTYVKNSSGSTITKGQAVYVTGADGTNALIGLASATADATSSKTLGIAANTMTQNAFGYVIENGQLSNIDTSAATAGSSVWLGATPGSLVFNTPPAEPDHAVYLGVVTKANPSTGEILVKVQNGYELDELHDVFVGGVSTALPLVYSSASSGWVAQALTSVGIAAGAIGSAQIATGAVDSAALASNAVVAAKIAAAAVGTAALSSGSATNGQVLVADGAGAASFATLVSGMSISASTSTATIANASTVVTSLNTSTGNASADARPIVVHPSSAIVYQNFKSAAGTTEWIRKIDADANTTMATYSITMTDSSEYIQNMAYGGSDKICVVTQGSFSRWLIIDAGTGSQLASGNILNVGTTPSATPKVRHDVASGQFAIVSTCLTAAATRIVNRFVDASTYTTKVHTWNVGTVSQANASATNEAFSSTSQVSTPIWLSGPSRWAVFHRYGSPTNGTGQFIFISASTATVDHLAITGKQLASTVTNYNSGNAGSNNPGIILSSTNTAICYTYGSGVTSSTVNRFWSVPISSISAAYNSTISTAPADTYNTSATYSNTTDGAIMSHGNHFAAIGANGRMYLAGGFNGFWDDQGSRVSANPWQRDSYTALNFSNPSFSVVGMNTINGISYGYYADQVTGSYDIKKAKLRSVEQPLILYSSSTATGLSLRAAPVYSSGGTATISASTASAYQIAASTLTTFLVSPGGTVSILISGSTASVDYTVSIPTWVMR